MMCVADANSVRSTGALFDLVDSMLDPPVTNQGVAARKEFVVIANLTSHFRLGRIVNRIFVPCQIVRPRENGVTRFPCRWINPHATVRAGLSISACDGSRRRYTVTGRDGFAMCLPSVLLQLCRSGKSLTAARIGASIGARIGRGIQRSGDGVTCHIILKVGSLAQRQCGRGQCGSVRIVVRARWHCVESCLLHVTEPRQLKMRGYGRVRHARTSAGSHALKVLDIRPIMRGSVKAATVADDIVLGAHHPVVLEGWEQGHLVLLVVRLLVLQQRVPR